MIQLTIKLFGAFRKYGNGEVIRLDLPTPTSVSELKKALSQKLTELHPEFNQAGLVTDSVFANDEVVLNPNTVLEKSGQLSVLPPVCGG
jgi:molybdopterin converting factor small subunit